MHLTAPRAPRARRLVFLALAGILVLLALAAPALAAKRPDYTGGPVVTNNDGKADFPLFVPNDYTVCALRFSVTGGTLYDDAGTQVTTAGVQYNVKVRLSPTAAPSGVDNRGFTWNPATSTWVQEREDWVNFPVVTTTAGGAITTSNTSWIYFRFGNTSNAGVYYLLVSLQPVGAGSGTTQNNASPPAVVVVDTTGQIAGATHGFVVHNGISAVAFKGKRAEARSDDGSDSVMALTRSVDTASAPAQPLQIMPDHWDGAAAVNGDFALGVPTVLPFNVLVQNAVWPAGASSFTGSRSDVNIAIGGAETTPPSAPGALVAAPRDGGAVLTWTAASDDTAVSRYIVYRWVDAPPGSGYTPLREPIATTTDLTYTDSSLTNSTTYHYAIRAEDAATNVGPISATADVTPDGTPPGPVTSFAATAGNHQVALGWTNPTDTDFAGVTVVRGEGYTPLTPQDGTVVYNGAGTSYTDSSAVNGTEYTYSAFSYDTAMNYGPSASATATPHAPIATTLTFSGAPATVKWGQSWQFTGLLSATGPVAIPDATVDLQKSTDGGVTWDKVQTVTPESGTSTYSATAAAPQQKTQYRLYYAGDTAFDSATSEVATVTPAVKLGTPNAPSKVSKGAKFTAYGSLSPKQTAGSKTIKIKCYLKSSGTWVLKKTVTATNANNGSATKYSAKFSLSPKGSWKLVAYSAATSKYAATTSGADYVTVK